ncbi:hypothetical protein STCU_00942 [Strigomonas culicis]|uniref:EF-hand domain-containing protein n=1 Tax=Strigomonas culicis TaxID=28005 RepID=S9UXZ8_9TRYP|nr:hypothetical protein STCU_00942 [Strigomonas culicis]|eukprot:EPY35732.1 hypothetical protein STCU_00942 [Strigomonas culicis]
MEILKNLNEGELGSLREAFALGSKHRLSEDEFVVALETMCQRKPLLVHTTGKQLRQLFAHIDVEGTGTVSWEDFTLFSIDEARSITGSPQMLQPGVAQGAGGPEDALRAGASSATVEMLNAYRPYHLESSVAHPFNVTIADMRCLPRTNKMVRLTVDAKGSSSLTVLNWDKNKQMYGRLPKSNEVVTTWDYIPPTGGMSGTNTLACAYKGGTVTLYPLDKKHTYDELLPPSKSLLFSETQTAMVWSSMYNRLLLGSRRGIVSVWEIDKDTASSQEKLHDNVISSMKNRSSLLFVGCLDRVNSVKAVDIEHSVVRFAFSDHMVGGVTTMEMDDEYLFTAGFEGKIVQRALQAPKSISSCLFDTVDPHAGRMTVLHRVPDTALLLSGDNRGS